MTMRLIKRSVRSKYYEADEEENEININKYIIYKIYKNIYI